MNRRGLLATILGGFGTLFLGEKASKANESKKFFPPDGDWRELTREEINLANNCIAPFQNKLAEKEKESKENIQKALDVLKEFAGYNTKEADEIRKTVTKRDKKTKEYKQEFKKRVLERHLLAREGVEGINGIVNMRDSRDFACELWSAIVITFRTSGINDGFAMLDIEFYKKVGDIAFLQEGRFAADVNGEIPLKEFYTDGIYCNGNLIRPIWAKQGQWIIWKHHE